MGVREVSRRQRAPKVEIRASAPCEFLLHLNAFSSPAFQAATTLGKAWFATRRAGVAPELLAAIERFSSPDETIMLWTRLLGPAEETPAPRDIPAFFAYFGALPPLQVRLALLGYHAQAWALAEPEALFLAAQGDAAALRDVAAKHFPRDRARRGALLALLAGDPAETRARLLVLMRRWYDEVFRDQEAEILPILARDARAKRGLRRALSLEQLVETATNGSEYTPAPGVRRLALLPTYISRPWTLRQQYRNALLLCYPVDEDSLVVGSDGLPARLIRLHQALGDERRLRILRQIAAEGATFQGLADALDLPKSSLHYHLGILRAAGLLRVRTEAKGVHYSLRRDGLTGMAEALLHYFEGGAT